MDCMEHPLISEEVWNRISDLEWTDGGWMIDGMKHWLAKDHPGPGGRVAWVLWQEDGTPLPENLIHCYFPEDAWQAVARGELVPERNCIRQRNVAFCLVSPGRENTIEIAEGPFDRERG